MGIDGGGALYAIDVANGHLVCGCGDINYRKPNMTFGVSRSSRAAEGPSQAVSSALPRRIYGITLLRKSSCPCEEGIFITPTVPIKRRSKISQLPLLAFTMQIS